MPEFLKLAMVINLAQGYKPVACTTKAIEALSTEDNALRLINAGTSLPVIHDTCNWVVGAWKKASVAIDFISHHKKDAYVLHASSVREGAQLIVHTNNVALPKQAMPLDYMIDELVGDICLDLRQIAIRKPSLDFQANEERERLCSLIEGYRSLAHRKNSFAMIGEQGLAVHLKL